MGVLRLRREPPQIRAPGGPRGNLSGLPRTAALTPPAAASAAPTAREGREPDLLRFTTAGSVDDGKSTLIGRLLYETNSAFLDHLAEARKHTTNRSVLEAGEEIDFSLLTDGLKAEREQGITIDVAYRYFSTARRRFIIADTPGHEQYTRNMATGASTANLALILVDARHGLLPQSKRHAFISSLLGIKHVVVCVNKMDLVGWDQGVFERIRGDFLDFAARLELPDLAFVPMSALKGDNVVRRSERMAWYQGPPLLALLESVHVGSDRNLIDLRLPVQLVLRPTQDFRGLAGQVASGVIRQGEELLLLPSRRVTRVARLVTREGDLGQACAPQAVTVVLEHELDASRGDMLVHPHNQPRVSRRLDAMVVWFAEAPLREGQTLLLQHTTQTVRARVEQVRYQVDVTSLRRSEAQGQLPLNGIGRVVLSAHRPIYWDPYRKNRATGALILVDPLTNGTAGAGMLLDRQPEPGLPAAPQPWSEVGAIEAETTSGAGLVSDQGELPLAPRDRSAQVRARLLGHRPLTVWLTGLPACGATEIADALERRLLAQGRLAYVLDGAELRRTLSQGLDWSPADTSEHLRRVSCVARMLNEAGLIAIASFVSPTRAMRAQARELIGPERFLEVHVASPLEWCQAHDQRGIYERARTGELLHVAGVNAPYEAPQAPDLVLRPDRDGAVAAAEAVLAVLATRS